MNDASGDNVDEHLDRLDAEHKQDENAAAKARDTAHLEPSRWFFAKSAFPMAAGTLGPVASAFSICALVRPWRQIIPPDGDITRAYFIEDPRWLIVINAIQLVVAIVANMFLLLNMARRIRFAIAQPVTIVGWYLSSVLLIALEATTAGPLDDVDEPGQLIWSGALYYGLFAAILYFLVASLMVVTFVGAVAGRYSKDFDLTTSQRTLMLQTIMLLLYLLLGALVFSTTEGWAYLDALYWADVTLLTVGFGDYAVSTNLGRALLFPYALVGIISLGLVIGSIRTLALERTEHKLNARIVEKKRRRTLRRMTKGGKDEVLVPISEDGGLQLSASDPASTTGLTEYDRRREEFRLMRKIQQQAERRRRWVALGISATTWATLWVVAAAIFQRCESPYQNWSYFDAIYFCFVSLTTIGYGDVTPVSPPGKAFFVFWSLLALPTTTVLVSNAGDTVVKAIRDSTDYIGNLTILPGERGFKRDLKGVLGWLSCGKVFDEDDIEKDVPGFLGAARRRQDDDDDDDGRMKQTRDDGGHEESTGLEKFVSDEKRKQDADDEADKKSEMNDRHSDSAPRHQDSPDTNKHSSRPLSLRKARTIPSSDDSHGPRLSSRTASIPRTDFPRARPASKAEYHSVLINEIQRVTQHLKSKPPRKYAFQEWAWYLELIGEDERRAETHRMAKPHVHEKTREKDVKKAETSDVKMAHPGAETKAEDAEETDRDAARMRWSWVGTRSPLMSLQEEAEWILEKLTGRLQAELSEVYREHERYTGKGKGRVSHRHDSIQEEDP